MVNNLPVHTLMINIDRVAEYWIHRYEIGFLGVNICVLLWTLDIHVQI